MATGTRTRPEADDEMVVEDNSSNDYRVLTDMFTFRYGRSKSAVARAPRGSIVRLDPNLVDIDAMIRLKAIGPVDGTKARTNVRAQAQAAGADDDPVPAPNAEIIESADPDAAEAEQATAE